MARKEIVTRTIIGTEVTVLALNTTTCEPFNAVYVINGKENDDKKLLKTVKKLYDTEEVSNVKIVSTVAVDKLYGMWQEDFIKNAMELDPTTRKPLNADADEVETAEN